MSLRTSERQDFLEDTERLEHGAQTASAEEMRGQRWAGEPRSIDEEDAIARSTQERRGDRPGDASADDEDVTLDLHLGSL